MNDPEHPLLKASRIEAGARRLSELTGLSRIRMEMRTLAPTETLSLDASGEQFLYVLDGSGTVMAADEPLTIGTGDFLALNAGERAVIRAESTLTVLTGGLSSA